MSVVQPITTLNIDGAALNVVDLSDKVQQLVAVYNDWNQKLADAQSTFALTQAGLNDLSRQIILQIKADQDAAAAAANDTATQAAVPAANDATVAPAAVTTSDASPVVTPTAKE